MNNNSHLGPFYLDFVERSYLIVYDGSSFHLETSYTSPAKIGKLCSYIYIVPAIIVMNTNIFLWFLGLLFLHNNISLPVVGLTSISAA